jgi:hypothetical protein
MTAMNLISEASTSEGGVPSDVPPRCAMAGVAGARRTRERAPRSRAQSERTGTGNEKKNDPISDINNRAQKRREKREEEGAFFWFGGGGGVVEKRPGTGGSQKRKEGGGCSGGWGGRKRKRK